MIFFWCVFTGFNFFATHWRQTKSLDLFYRIQGCFQKYGIDLYGDIECVITPLYQAAAPRGWLK